MAADLFPFSIQVKLDQTETYSIPQKLDIVVRVNSDTQERDNLGQSTTEEYHPFGVTTVYSLGGGLEESYRPVRYSGRGGDDIGLSHYGYRYYQPWAGKWLISDYQESTDQMNLFQAVNNSANK
ncbi:hypothetical protein ONV78_16350 [Hahella sp. CR1]|uniref:RHS repeat-associated core domain-containing protein n=1 Tax=Hahella sp. CR1 TaxID=2992807 RepID=UPI002441B54C|nr:RHS repeat-associated core domain-containing protein [Hahella sp. CR1]MDG9669312.1 hypothetical protein [Hahella sp. CR1]